MKCRGLKFAFFVLTYATLPCPPCQSEATDVGPPSDSGMTLCRGPNTLPQDTGNSQLLSAKGNDAIDGILLQSLECFCNANGFNNKVALISVVGQYSNVASPYRNFATKMGAHIHVLISCAMFCSP